MSIDLHFNALRIFAGRPAMVTAAEGLRDE